MAEESVARTRPYPPAAAIASASLFTMPYLLVCVAQMLGYANKLMLDPVLPLYLAGIGLTPALIGATVAAFSAASFLLRPWVGQGVDRWSPRGVYALGGLALAVPSALYAVPAFGVLLVLRMLHGLGWACINTAGGVMASAEARPGRRGEALAYFTMGRGLAKAIAPALGLWLMSTGGVAPVLVVATGFGLAAAGVGLVLRDRDPHPTPAAPTRARPAADGQTLPRRARGSLIEPGALLPFVLNLTLTSAQPVTSVFIVLYAADRHIENLPVYFILGGVITIAAQPLARFSDTWGRAPVIAVAFVLSVAGLGWMLAADSLLPLAIGGVLFSAGSALGEPSLMALAIDRGRVGHHGSAVATYTASFQIGAGSAGLLWGLVIERAGLGAMFVGAIGFLLVGLAILVANWSRAGHRPVHQPA